MRMRLPSLRSLEPSVLLLVDGRPIRHPDDLPYQDDDMDDAVPPDLQSPADGTGGMTGSPRRQTLAKKPPLRPVDFLALTPTERTVVRYGPTFATRVQDRICWFRRTSVGEEMIRYADERTAP